ncbi:MAG: tRNA preQ1(34) S-adenosylmethionine ribosyltransferase-isomerase QueA [Oscillospiraceae bacterium]|nr:tRNA preQ1(34) S-adenosylmethionine ribosyltransferase-isomerase QueA [Oscillospiraceae bacterium]
MNTSDFDYHLPEELIAQHPADRRDASRMMRIDKLTGAYSHGKFTDLPDLMREGDCLVVNDSKVMPARLLGVCEKTRSPVELLLLNDLGDSWECLGKPGKRLREGARLVFGDSQITLQATVTKIRDDGNREVRFEYEGVFLQILDGLGEIPLPPYITEKLEDKSRYQTVYARERSIAMDNGTARGSAAAPTAGLHFTPQIFDALRDKGVKIAPITLHVGLGTFRPVKTARVEEHHMHNEFFHIPVESARIISDTKRGGGRVIAAGTTCCRTLEGANFDFALENPRSISGSTNIFIYPGCNFKVIDGLLTNFHLPQSTLIMLVSALLGREQTLAVYAAAVAQRYRFFSFGDCMVIL